MTSNARRQGDHDVLNGAKAWITNGGLAEFYTVLAYTDRSKGTRGITAFVVPRGVEGLSVGKREEKMGQRASNTTSVTFDNVVVPVENRIGEEGQGFKILMKTFDKSRPGVGAWAVGLARCALDHAIRYARERRQFGRPIADFQSLRFMIARAARDIEAARLLTWKAAWEVDQGVRATVHSSMSKWFAAETAVRTASLAVQVFGGYGYSREYPVEKLYRDAKVFEIYEGTSQIQQLIVARSLFA